MCNLEGEEQAAEGGSSLESHVFTEPILLHLVILQVNPLAVNYYNFLGKLSKPFNLPS